MSIVKRQSNIVNIFVQLHCMKFVLFEIFTKRFILTPLYSCYDYYQCLLIFSHEIDRIYLFYAKMCVCLRDVCK